MIDHCRGEKGFRITVQPVYNGHPRDLKNMPLNIQVALNIGSLNKVFTGHDLMSILMANHLIEGNSRIINTL